jgi:hypothetical protein
MIGRKRIVTKAGAEGETKEGVTGTTGATEGTGAKSVCC